MLLLWDVGRTAEETTSKNDDSAKVIDIAVVFDDRLVHLEVVFVQFNVWIVPLEGGFVADSISDSKRWFVHSFAACGVCSELELGDGHVDFVAPNHGGCFLLSASLIVLVNIENQETVFVLWIEFESIGLELLALVGFDILLEVLV